VALVARRRDRRRQSAAKPGVIERLEDRTLLVVDFLSLPLHFEPNEGQTDAQIDYLARGDGYGLFLSPTEAVLVLKQESGVSGQESIAAAAAFSLQPPASSLQPSSVLRMSLVGADPAAHGTSLEPLGGHSNYFIGNDPAEWHTDVPHLARVRFDDVYPGIDVVYYGTNQRQLEFDFVVSPGADPSVIELEFAGATGIELDTDGNLILHVPGGDVVQHAPVVYQDIAGVRQPVSGRYVIQDSLPLDHQPSTLDPGIRFEIGSYDPLFPLVIDPVLSYSTYLGGTGDDIAYAVAYDSSGNAYVAGYTDSNPFPTVSGSYDESIYGPSDAFISKLNSTGTALLYSTYLGGIGYDAVFSIAVDSSGAAYLTGRTDSATGFPTANALQSTYGGGAYDATVTKLNATGNAIVYSTYLGGSFADQGDSIAVDSSGNAYITGHTGSDNFPTVGSIQGSRGGGNDVFAAKLSADGSSLTYSTYLGGDGDDRGTSIGIDSSGNAYVTGFTESSGFPTASPYQGSLNGTRDAFLSKINAAGSSLVYSTFLGGSDLDVGYGVAVNSSGIPTVVGYTASSNFPTASPFQASYGGGTQDAFLTAFNSAGSSLTLSTYLGGDSQDIAYDLAVDSAGRSTIVGVTSSSNFPTADPLQRTKNGGSDAFVTRLSASGASLDYSTYLGAASDETGWGVALDGLGDAIVVGETASSGFPIANAVQSSLSGARDSFITRIVESFCPGDILVADAFTATLSIIDAGNGSQSVLSSGGSFSRPNGIAVSSAGDIYVADYEAVGTTGAIFKIDPVIGAQTTVASGGNFVDPYDLAIEASGQLIVVDVTADKVIRVNPADGTQTVLAEGGFLTQPRGVAIESNGQILVTDELSRRVIRIDPVTGAQTSLSSGGDLVQPGGIALESNGQILVADLDASDGNSAVIRINPVTGTQTVVSSGGSFINPIGVSVVPSGDLLVIDANAGLFRVNAVTGFQRLLSSGGNFFSPARVTFKASTFCRVGGEFRVNTATSGSQETRPDGPRSVATDADGDLVAVWESAATTGDGDGLGIAAQRYNALGVPQGAEFRVNTVTTGHQRVPEVAADADGDFVVVWTNQAGGGVEFDVSGQRYSAAGVALGGEFRANTYTSGTQEFPAIAVDADGDFVIAWMSDAQDGGGFGIFAQRYNAAGVPQGGEFQVNVTTANNQWFPAVAMDADGDFVVVWESFAQDGSDYGIFGRRFGSNGLPLSGEFQINTTTSGAQSKPAVAMDASGDFVVAWASAGQDGSGDGVFAQRYNAAGAAQGGEFRVNVTTAGDQKLPSVASDVDGDFTVTWESDGTDGDSFGIYSRRYTAAGTAAGTEFRVNTTTAGAQRFASPGMDADGNTTIVWSGNGPGDSDGVFAQRYDVVADTAGPVVTDVLVAGDRVEPGERLVQTVSQAVVTFSEDLSVAGGATGANSVTNPANWSISRDGTEIAGGISGVTFAFNATTNKYEATVTFDANGATSGTPALGDGYYVLTVKSSIRDLAGNALDGNFDGAPGGDFTRMFTIAQPVATGSEFRVNTTVAGVQDSPTVGVDALGNFVVAWSGVSAQRFSASGVALGSEFTVHTTAATSHVSPAVAVDADGDFVIVWENRDASSNPTGIYGRRFNAAGVAQGDDFLISEAAAPGEMPAVAIDSMGNFVVAWHTAATPVDVYARRYTAAGQDQGLITVNTTTTGVQNIAAVARAANSDFVIAWTGEDADGRGVFAQRFSADGVKQGGEFQVNNLVTAGNQFACGVAMDADGDFVVTWSDSCLEQSGTDVRARRFNARGVALGDEFRVNATATNAQKRSSVGMDADGDFVIVWESQDQDGSGAGVFGQRYNAAGQTLGSEFQVNTTTTSDQRIPAVAVDADGDFVVVWSGNGPGDSDGVFAQRFAGPFTYVVNTTADTSDGSCDLTHCTLREAINASNSGPGIDRIIFNIPSSGPHTIAPTSALPTITDPVVIDGTTEPDFAGGPVIELNGSYAGAGVDGLRITAGGSTVRGLVINRFGGDGIQLDTAGGNTIEGNYIGTNTSGTGQLPGTVTWYRADGNAVDSVSGLNGSINGGVEFVPGKSGTAFDFGAETEFVSVPNAAALEPASSITVEGWVKATAPGESR
jgi:CSLREA domain-containing protein